MAIIVTPSISAQSPAIVTFDPAGVSNQICSLEIEFGFISGVTVDVAIALQIINLIQYRFDGPGNSFLLNDECDNCMNGDKKTLTFRIKRISPIPIGGMPGCSIRVITWDKTSKQQADKRVISTTFNV